MNNVAFDNIMLIGDAAGQVKATTGGGVVMLLTAAKYAALGGAKTLLIEKRKEVGAPVQCGEFLPSLDELRGLMPGAFSLDDLLDVEGRFIARKTNKVIVFSPKGKKYESDFKGMVIERRLFDRSLADDAVSAGSELMTETGFMDLSGSNKKISTNKGTFEGNVIIGADGPTSRVAKSAGVNEEKDLAPCVQYEIAGDFKPVIKMYSGGVAPGGYAWIIPKKRGANVGLGVQRRFYKGSLKDLLDKFAEKIEVGGKIISRTAGLVPCSGTLKKTVNGNVMLVGDAAGHVMASNGGGIPIAMICGRVAGEVAAEYISSGMPLDGYEKIWRSQVGKTLDDSLKNKKIADTLFRSDTLLEMSMNKLGMSGMEKVVRCKKLI